MGLPFLTKPPSSSVPEYRPRSCCSIVHRRWSQVVYRPSENQEMNVQKQASPDHPIHELMARRWSPYAFSERLVSDDHLRSLFEAARWAASSYNEQPWSYIVATKADPAAF